jgi:hypothetical protein
MRTMASSAETVTPTSSRNASPERVDVFAAYAIQGVATMAGVVGLHEGITMENLKENVKLDVT